MKNNETGSRSKSLDHREVARIALAGLQLKPPGEQFVGHFLRLVDVIADGANSNGTLKKAAS